MRQAGSLRVNLDRQRSGYPQAHAAADRHADPNPNRHANSHPHRDADPNRNRHADCH